MLKKIAPLAHSKIAIAILGAALIVGGGTAVALAAANAHTSSPSSASATHTAQSPTHTPDPNDHNHGHTVSIEGTLKAYDASAKTIGVQGEDAKSATTIAVNSSTEVNGEHVSALSDLTKNIGHKVEVQATKQSNGALLAWKITVSSDDGDQGKGDTSALNGNGVQQHVAERTNRQSRRLLIRSTGEGRNNAGR